MGIDFHQFNWLAILAAAMSTFLIGGIWYSIFEKPWMGATNLTKERLQERNMPLVFGASFLLSFVMALNLAMFIGPNADVHFGMMAGFHAGFGWVCISIGIISLFEKRPLKYVLINGGYMTAALTVMGTILGAWH